MEELFLSSAVESVDVLRQEVGLRADYGATLRTAPVYCTFPASFEGNAGVANGRSIFRVRTANDAIVTGAKPPSNWVPRDGLPLVYITFGTVTGRFPRMRGVYRAALDAIAPLPVHALLTTGPVMEAENLGAIPKNVTVETFVPQAAVWQHATALLSHGGSGTVLGALAAGVPMVVTPLFADQPNNARAVEKAGAGIVVPFPDATSLRAALRRVLIEQDFRTNARRIAEEIAALPSMDNAIDAMLAQ
jgi:MGT family glycosyltransferase